MRKIVGSIEGEYRRYKALAEGAIRQLSDAQLSQADSQDENCIAALVWHVSGNLKSRFTDFLTADGEKPWRDRESEFTRRQVSHAELADKWSDGWDVLFAALQALGDGQLDGQVTIRGVPLAVHEALHRSLAHTSYHVGQIVFRAKGLCGARWQYLSIPPGQSAEYNKNPTAEKGPGPIQASGRHPA